MGENVEDLRCLFFWDVIRNYILGCNSVIRSRRFDTTG